MLDFPALAPRAASSRSALFDWSKPCAYDEHQKKAFHRTAAKRLRALALLIGWDKTEYDLRSNKAGIAVSGEITLHHERIYIQISQFTRSTADGILYRTCRGRRDYTGGHNNFADLALLDDLPTLAALLAPLLTGPPGP